MGCVDHDGLTQHKVAAALSGLFDPDLSAGLLCLAGMWDREPIVERNLFRAAYRISKREEWDLPKGPEPIERLVLLAMLEMTGPSVVCGDCGSSGVNPHPWRPGESRACERCEGRGRLPRLEEPRYSLIGIGKANWYKVWRGRYGRVHGVLNDWVLAADDHLRKQLNREAREHRRFG